MGEEQRSVELINNLTAYLSVFQPTAVRVSVRRTIEVCSPYPKFVLTGVTKY